MSDDSASMAEPVSEIDRLKAELRQWGKWGIIEIAIRNPSVFEYMKHWEGRALKAEADLAAAREKHSKLLKYALSMRAAMHAFGVDGGCLPEFDRDYPNEMEDA